MNIFQAFFAGLPQVVVHLARLILTNTFADHIPYDFETSVPPDRVYDFIVVGAGCAGSVVASRLSETTASVLLLEAGGNAPPESAMPMGTFLLFGGDIGWRIKGVPQRNAQIGYVNNSSYALSARTMGGSTAMNGMVYVRGSRQDYDNWNRLGNTGWDYNTVLPYFMKTETFSGNKIPGSAAYRGTRGPLSVESRRTASKITAAFLEAGKELGYEEVDGSGPRTIGVSPVYTTTKSGVRHSAAESFLRPVVHRRNLKITPKAYVTRVLFNKDNRAVGVVYLYQGKRRIARARKEVILSAGALNTPKLLMLSGVGPQDQLAQIGIPIVSPLEGVGRNFMDHPNTYLTWRVNKGSAVSVLDIVNPSALKNYIKRQTGVYSDTPGLECNSWFNVGNDDLLWPDVQLSVSSLSYATDRGILMPNALGLKKEIYEALYGEFYAGAGNALTINPNIARPRSRGTVKLRSADPEDLPLVDHNYFDHPDDMVIMLRAIRQAQKLVKTRAMAEGLGATPPNKKFTPCEHHSFDTDQYWECYVRYSVGSLWHYAGTAKMAPDTDEMGVVSNKLRVRGVSGLRVIDASIMPQLVTSNTQAATYMIAERGSDMIKQDWGYSIDPLPVPGL